MADSEQPSTATSPPPRTLQNFKVICDSIARALNSNRPTDVANNMKRLGEELDDAFRGLIPGATTNPPSDLIVNQTVNQTVINQTGDQVNLDSFTELEAAVADGEDVFPGCAIYVDADETAHLARADQTENEKALFIVTRGSGVAGRIMYTSGGSRVVALVDLDPASTSKILVPSATLPGWLTNKASEPTRQVYQEFAILGKQVPSSLGATVLYYVSFPLSAYASGP